MSQAGRSSGPAAKRRELQARLAEASAQHAATEAEPSAMTPEQERELRAHVLFIRCKAVVVERRPSLWPGESIGAAIAEQWLQNVAARMRAQAIEQMRAQAAEAGIALPS
jgi:hypothetical protein